MNTDSFKDISEKLKEKEVRLVAVSKTKPVEDILQLYRAGQKVFGENKAQELAEKYTLLPLDIEWHMIGHLQRNKVKYIAPFVSMIHSIDSLKILQEVDKRAADNDRVIDCLLQVHIAEEETKFGLSEGELDELLASDELKELNHIRICGLMGMATFTEDEAQVKREFCHLKSIFNTVKAKYFADTSHFKELSMGMSGDYEWAVEEGSTMVRIGSLLFGERTYH